MFKRKKSKSGDKENSKGRVSFGSEGDKLVKDLLKNVKRDWKSSTKPNDLVVLLCYCRKCSAYSVANIKYELIDILICSNCKSERKHLEIIGRI